MLKSFSALQNIRRGSISSLGELRKAKTGIGRAPMAKSTTAESDVTVKHQQDGTYTTLRRTTRSSLRNAEEKKPSLDLSSFAYSAQSPRKRVKREATEVKEEPLSEIKDEPTTPVKRSRSASSTPVKASKNGFPKAARTKAHAEPPKWREQYALIERMRAGISAPVDTMCAVS